MNQLIQFQKKKALLRVFFTAFYLLLIGLTLGCDQETSDVQAQSFDQSSLAPSCEEAQVDYQFIIQPPVASNCKSIQSNLEELEKLKEKYSKASEVKCPDFELIISDIDEKILRNQEQHCDLTPNCFDLEIDIPEVQKAAKDFFEFDISEHSELCQSLTTIQDFIFRYRKESAQKMLCYDLKTHRAFHAQPTLKRLNKKHNLNKKTVPILMNAYECKS